MANTKISALTANTNPTWSEEFVYAYNNANGKITLNTMKAFVWWAWITTLSSDANIWELSDGFYETSYDLYYKSWNKTPTIASWGTKKQMLFVTSDGTTKWYFVFGAWTRNSNSYEKASFGHSTSSSDWSNRELRQWDASLNQYGYSLTPFATTDALAKYNLTQIVDNISWGNTNELSIVDEVYPWVTYTIIVNSVSSAYSITLGTWVTNPLGITLPTSSNKKCIITLVTTSSTTAIVTWCTMAS